MPTSTRRQAHARRDEEDMEGLDETNTSEVTDSRTSPRDEQMAAAIVASYKRSPGEADEEVSEEEDFDLEPFPPPGLKEISSLASWTVSSAKPGNGVRALRSADTAQFWQSDGPQPHLLSIHFFKLVAIVHMRIYLDFHADESYTPTKIQFLAGMGVHDIQEFAEMTFDQPVGWIDVDFSRVGSVGVEQEGEEDEGLLGREVDWSLRPVLRAFLVQVRILENHQNGKDTHLRAVQLFARDESQDVRRALPSSPVKRTLGSLPMRSGGGVRSKGKEAANIKMAAWMQDPDLR